MTSSRLAGDEEDDDDDGSKTRVRRYPRQWARREHIKLEE